VGSLGRHGSAHAEQNHSSYCAMIGPSCVEEPEVAVKNMMLRHLEFCKRRNEEIVRGFLQDQVSLRKLKAKNGWGDNDVPAGEVAKLSLGSWGYMLFLTELDESRLYSKTDLPNGDFQCQRAGSAAPPRVIKVGESARNDSNGERRLRWKGCSCAGCLPCLPIFSLLLTFCPQRGEV